MATELTVEEEKTDWYAILALEVSADTNSISKSFKKLSLRWHPDKNGGSQEANDMFMRVKEAKLFLMDDKKRKLYDEKRAARLKMETLLVSFFFFPDYFSLQKIAATIRAYGLSYLELTTVHISIFCRVFFVSDVMYRFQQKNVDSSTINTTK